MSRRLRHEDYTVGWICALPVELAAAQEMLDEEHEDLDRDDNDENLYSLGSIAGHNVVIVCLPAGRIGNNPAAAVTTRTRATFKGLRFGLMVGIGGGVASAQHDIRLGDVVVSQPQQASESSGVIQYDFGKTTPSGFVRTGSLQAPPQVLLAAVAKVRAKQLRRKAKLSEHLSRFDDLPEFHRQHAGPDVLFEAEYGHPEGSQTCNQCDTRRQVTREPRPKEDVVVHYGTIASGNQVMKDGRTRDTLSNELGGVLCFEMEAAGLMNSFACLVVRGICDYADSHKNKKWQPFAAAAAAAYVKEILLAIPRSDAIPPAIPPAAPPLEIPAVLRPDSFKTPVTQPKLPVYCMPFSRNKYFVGREKELELIHNRLMVDRDCQQLSIVGLGGTGKTQIALQFAYTVKKAWPKYSIFWVPAVSMDSFEQGYANIAKALDLPATEGEEDVKEQVQQYLSEGRAWPWLLIVDNADDLGVAFGTEQSQGIVSYLPDNEQGIILYTTRTLEAAWQLTRTDIMELDAMSLQDANNFLDKLVRRKKDPESDKAANELLEEIAYLPLAIAQAAAYLNVNRVSITQYLQLLRDTEQDVISLLSREFRDDTRYKTSANAVASTWVISFSQIHAHDKVAADLLSFMACLEWKAIPHSLLPKYESKEKVTNAIGTLCAYSFVNKRDDTEHTYDLHRLVHLATRIWMIKYGDLSATVNSAIVHVSDQCPHINYQNRRTWQAYLPHALRLLHDKCSDLNAKAELALKVGKYFTDEGKLKEGLRWIEESMKIRGEFDESNHDRLRTERILGYAYRRNGHIQKSANLLEHIVEVENSSPEDHPKRLVSQHELASVYIWDGQYAKAIELYEHIVNVEDQILDEDDDDRLASQHNLAVAYQKAGSTDKALSMIKGVVAIRDQLLAEDDPIRLHSQSVLALIYIDDGKLKEALRLLEHVRVMEEKVFVEEDPRRLTTLHWLAHAYRMDGQKEKTRELFEYIVSVDKIRDESHPERLEFERELVALYQDTGQPGMGTLLLEQIVNIQKWRLNEDSPKLLAAQEALAQAYVVDGQMDKAIELSERIVNVREKSLVKDGLEWLELQHNLGMRYREVGRTRKSIKTLEHVVARRKELLGEDHLDVLASEHELASVLDEEDERAMAMLEHIVAVYKKTHGEGHADLLTAQHNLARRYRLKGRFTESISLLEHVIAVGVLKEDDINQLISQHALAQAYRKPGQLQRAADLLTHVVEMWKKVVNEDHSGRQRSEAVLAQVLKELNQDEGLDEALENWSLM